MVESSQELTSRINWTASWSLERERVWKWSIALLDGHRKNGTWCWLGCFCWDNALAGPSEAQWLKLRADQKMVQIHSTSEWWSFRNRFPFGLKLKCICCIRDRNVLYLCISMYIFVYLCISMYIYVYLCISMYIYVYLCISMYIYVYLCISMYIYVYLCIPMYIYVYLCISMYIYVYLCISR